MFGFGKKIISDDELALYCSALTGKQIHRNLGGSFVRRNTQREHKNEERSRSIGVTVYKTECYDLVLNFDGHDLIDAFQSDNELIVLTFTYDGLEFPTASLAIDSSEKWGTFTIEVALNNIGPPYITDSIEQNQAFGATEIEMSCEVAKWMIAKGLNGGASAAYKGVTRNNYEPIKPMGPSDLHGLLD